MSLFWGFVLGLIQGLTEFLPVSSSAHLTFAGVLAKIREEEALPFFLILHLGTLIALLLFFKKDLVDIAKGLLKREKESVRISILIIITSLPTAIIGLGLKKTVEKAMVSPYWAALFLLVTAFLLFITKLNKGEKTGVEDMSVLSALYVGVAQGISALPGISRSGATIVASLFCGLKRDDAFRYSFLASIPAVGGAFLLDLREILKVGGDFGAPAVAAGFLTALVAGFLSLIFLRKAVIKGNLHYFGFYCIPASLLGFLIGFYCL